MNTDSKRSPKQASGMRGFTLLELVVVVAVITITTVISMPSFLRAMRNYQLNDAAARVAGVLKFTRYEGIRLNVPFATPLSARVIQAGAAPVVTNVFTDSNNNGTVQNTEKQILLSGNVNLVSAATPPNTGGLAAAVGVVALTNVPLANGFIAFDHRGAVAPAAVDVLYVGNLALPNLGYRAIVVLPSGSIEIWTTDSTGNWQQLN